MNLRSRPRFTSPLLFGSTLALAIGCGAAPAEEDDDSVGSVTDALCAGVGLTSNASAGTVTFTAAGAACAAGETAEYRFVHRRDGTTQAVEFRGWGASPTAALGTAGLPSGKYIVTVYVRALGSTKSYESRASATVSVGNVCSAVTLAAAPAGSTTVGTAALLTATATCTGGTPEFHYQVKPSGGSYTDVRGWSTTRTASWNTGALAAGSYALLVEARVAGNLAAEARTTMNYRLDPAPVVVTGSCGAPTVTFTPKAPSSIGTTLTVTAASTCTAGTPEFRFSHANPGVTGYTEFRGWGGASATFSTSGLPGGTHGFSVVARPAGSTGSGKAKAVTYLLGDVCNKASLTVDGPVPAHAGATLTYQAGATCVDGGVPEYRFSRKASGTNDWQFLGGWGSDRVAWDTHGVAAGTHNFRVEVRGHGHLGEAESFKVLDQALAPADCSDGQTRTVACGALNAGTQAEFCSSGEWYQRTACTHAKPTSGGYQAMCAARKSGQLACWGNTDANLFPGGPSWYYGGLSSTTPVDVPGLTDIASVALGLDGGCALRRSGSVVCWGHVARGDGNPPPGSPYPSASVTGLADAIAISHIMDYDTTPGAFCALRATGAVVCWGSNPYGSLGDGTLAERLTPVPVVGLGDVIALAPFGLQMMCAIRSSGQAVCWGADHVGQLGNPGYQTQSTTPVPVAGLTDAVAITGASSSTCAVRRTGAVACWGKNDFGQLGNGTLTASETPVAVLGIGDAIGVTSTQGRTCALRASGSVSCWGGTPYPAPPDASPVAVPALHDAIDISSGGGAFLALRPSGALVAWGHANNQPMWGDGKELFSGSDVHTIPTSILGFPWAPPMVDP